jgi:hypothetical protein
MGLNEEEMVHADINHQFYPSKGNVLVVFVERL